jgi:1,2-diacylglycerol 3-beta-glucosyltransferase
MPDNSWSNPFTRKSDAVDPITDLDDLDTLEPLIPDSDQSNNLTTYFERGMAGRRRKAAMAITTVWAVTIGLHLVSWGIWCVCVLTAMVSIHSLRLVFAHPNDTPDPILDNDAAHYPYVSIMVSAKNEEVVVESLVRSLCNLDYPSDRYDLWIIDDDSSDRTPELLDQLACQYEQLNVIHRPANEGGGKSGALNQVYPQVKGDIIAVFDADAHVPKDLLRHVLPMFNRDAVGAVQVRKAVLQGNPNYRQRPKNFWISGQVAEMALDSYFQQRRIAIGGIGELRGNGQFVRRCALDRCGGWNEQTITDDLDLTLRLHLDHWDIDFLTVPAVEEEGVTRAIALWHQRNRWAEGGYQRYLDYWRLIIRNRLGAKKTADLFIFWLMQYLLPTAAVPDTMMAIARSTPPLLSPLTGLTLILSMVGMVVGLRRIHRGEYLAREAALGSERSPTPRATLPLWRATIQAMRGTVYMLHWLVVVASTTARISVRPKRLKWVKTVHQGNEPLWSKEAPEQAG